MAGIPAPHCGYLTHHELKKIKIKKMYKAELWTDLFHKHPSLEDFSPFDIRYFPARMHHLYQLLALLHLKQLCLSGSVLPKGKEMTQSWLNARNQTAFGTCSDSHGLLPATCEVVAQAQHKLCLSHDWQMGPLPVVPWEVSSQTLVMQCPYYMLSLWRQANSHYYIFLDKMICYFMHILVFR